MKLKNLYFNFQKRKDDKRTTDDDKGSKKLTFITTFRINKDTTFINLKDIACNFWVLWFSNKKKEFIFQRTTKEENNLTDENDTQLPEGAKIQEYFKSHSQDLKSIILLLKPSEASKVLTPGMIES